MNDDDLSRLVTTIVSQVDGVERFYRVGGVRGTLRALAARTEPSAAVRSRDGRTVVEANLGVDGSEPVGRTLAAAADAAVAALGSAGIEDLEVTVRVSRIL
jgi:hypothetical protein